MFRLDEDHEELRALAREIATEQVAPHAAAVDAEGRFPRESVEALTRAGLHAIGIPEQYGGQGASLLGSAVVAEEIARACTTTQQVIGGNELFTWPLLLGGSEEVKQRYLTRIAAGECLGAFALSEPEAGSDVAAMTTRARREGDHYVLKGTKRWITNAGEAGLYVVFAVTDPQAGARGISAFVLEATDEGIELGGLERKMGLKGSPTREVVMRDVRIPADRIVGEEGQGLRLALGTLDRTRAIVAAQAVGVAQGALDVAVRYARERRQFGRPIGEFQGVAFMLADMEMRLRAARLLTYAAAEEAEAAGPDMSVAGATAKCFASDAAMAITVDAVQVLGGAGYTADFPVERMMRDAKITQIYEGTNQIQRIVVSRALLGAR
ncbi:MULTISPECIES: acyl-CoA dehydrogenase family protein [Arsenicicoccus]|uniref:Acyl-CoA dehydrogenase family protein n=1 Tax=Arsenicicoccus bolidensis TaxID=229480 RepID=A0ABS9PZQ3_9MICO|nr:MULTISPECIES: acyl-CoA dehydrogenase family protein [Arsenicicoccus]MCG7321115.1 acyl-CoA dehydrogenase family protein [Arsenicicoccus bolidensis]